MNFFRPLKPLAETILKTWILLGFLLGFPLVGSEDGCLELGQILNLLNRNVPHSKIIQIVKEKGVNFKLDVSNTRKIARADAPDALFDAIDNHACEPPISITSPKPSAQVGRTVRVEGKSKDFPGRYLWIFVHVEGLELWWPQRGGIKLKPDGTWRQGAHLGGSQDIGFDFEITAIWVDRKTNQDLKTYLSKGEKSGHYPGMLLPEGEPSALVTVHKVTH